jgi:flagellar biosynthesis/type III secretory pathway M-ring protein FliF/YscJ
MKVVLLLLSIIAFIVIASIFSQFMMKRVERIESEKAKEKESQSQSQSEMPKNESFKEVLKKENCSSTTKRPKDINDIQNLTKFNHGTYRDEKGRFKSKKE